MDNTTTPKTPRFSVDRTLSVPVGVQLRGQIEYGIACGELERGSRLPSVRELAQELGIAPVTVAQVYKDLLARGLIVTHAGRGTFVASAAVSPSARNFTRVRAMLGEVLERAAQDGITPDQVAELLNTLRPRAQSPRPSGVRIAMIGLFDEVTRAYAHDLQESLRPEDHVTALTLDQVRSGQGRRSVHEAHLVLALAHRVSETRELLPGIDVLPVGFIPSPATRAALASLDPRVRLGLVATFEDFLPTFNAGVKRFAPHVSAVRATHVHATDLKQLLDWSDVVVYASGSDRIVQILPPGTTAFEYRHTLDPRDLEQLVLPSVQAQRDALAGRKDE